MNYLSMVLGDSFILLFIGAAIAAVVSAYSKAQALAGQKAVGSETDARNMALAKAAVLVGFTALIYTDSDDLMDTVIRVSVPIGLYKAIQTLLTPIIGWRLMEVANNRPVEGPSNG